MKRLFFIAGLLFVLGCEYQLVEVKVMVLDTNVPNYSKWTRVHYQLVEYPLYKNYEDILTSETKLQVGDHYLQSMNVLTLRDIQYAYQSSKYVDYNIQTSPLHEEVTPAEEKQFKSEWERQNSE